MTRPQAPLKTGFPRALAMLAAALFVLAPWQAAHAQFFFDSFELGGTTRLRDAASGWTVQNIDGTPATEGNAFWNQPTFGDNVKVMRIRPAGFQSSMTSYPNYALGGDYLDAPYPVSHEGDFWIGTYESRPNATTAYNTVQGDGPQGIALSREFTIGGWNPAVRYISFLIGGGCDGTREKLELITPRPVYCPVDCRVRNDACCTAPAIWDVVRIFDPAMGSLRPASDTGQCTEQFRQVTWDMWGNLSPGNPYPDGTRVRFRITDSSSAGWGHINVDRIQTGSANPVYPFTQKNPLWGIADLHGHWMSHMGFSAGPAAIDSVAVNYPLDTFGSTGLVHGLPYVGQGLTRPTTGWTAAQKFAYALQRCDGREHNHSRDNSSWQLTNDIADHVIAGVEGWEGANGDFQTGAAGCRLWGPWDCWHGNWGVSGTSFQTYPKPFFDHAHQQMYWEWVHRAWQGGLRLLVTHTVSTRALEAGLGLVNQDANGFLGADTTQDWKSIRRQVCAMKKLAQEPEIRSWLEIAYTPADARRIVANGKLAVVLGVEADQIGSLGFSTAREEVDALVGVGLRHIYPIHLADNANGGMAVYNDTFNTNTDLLNSGGCPPNSPRCNGVTQDDPDVGGDAPVWPLAFSAAEPGCTSGVPGDGTCSTFKLAFDPRDRLFKADHLVRFRFVADIVGNHPDTMTVIPSSFPFDYTQPALANGMRNRQGLTPYGRTYLDELMRRGAIIDIDHMSEKAAQEFIGRTGTDPGLIFPTGCTDHRNPACASQAYPVVSGHNGFRQLAILESHADPARTSIDKGKWANEALRTPEQIERIYAVGGIIGMGTSFNDVQTDTTPGWVTPPVANDCAGSSKSFATAYYYLRSKVGRGAIALGTDFNGLVTQSGPRFGDNGCYGRQGDTPRNSHGERDAERARQRDYWGDGVWYEDSTPTVVGESPYWYVATYGWQPKLKREVLPGITDFKPDFNLHGLMNYGLLPDLLQDVVNSGDLTWNDRMRTLSDMENLHRGAEGYVQAWEKSIRVCQQRYCGGTACAYCNPGAPADAAGTCEVWNISP